MNGKLLALKPVIWHVDAQKLTFPHDYDWEIPYLQVIETTCAANTRHVPPHKDCNCGIYLSMDEHVMSQFVQTSALDQILGRVSTVGVFQMMGDLFVDGKIVRAGRIYPWGIIIPEFVRAVSQSTMEMTWADHMVGSATGRRLICYDDLQDALWYVRRTWEGVHTF